MTEDEGPRHGTYRGNIVELRDWMQSRIDGGDIDFDGWVYATRDTINTFIADMDEIGVDLVGRDGASTEPSEPKKSWFKRVFGERS